VTLKRFMTMTAAIFLCALPTAAQGAEKPTKRADPPAHSDLAAARAKLEQTVEEYKQSLRVLIPKLEVGVDRQSAKVAKLKDLVESGIVSRRELEDEQLELTKEQADLAAKKKDLVEADAIVEEADAADQLARAPLPRNGYLATHAILRYSGMGSWQIANIARVESFYSSHFGRQLPISAYGQTALHDRLGFDHHNSVDVAVQPDSPEGQALIGYLRSSGIPFLAFREAIPGKATGPHIHIGFPSHRFR
jgi:hypothetical protein